MQKIEKIINEIKELNVADLIELISKLKEVFNLTDEILSSSNSSKNNNNDKVEEVVDVNKKVSVTLSSLGEVPEIKYVSFIKNMGVTVIQAKEHISKIKKNESAIIKDNLSLTEAQEIVKQLKTEHPSLVVEIK